MFGRRWIALGALLVPAALSITPEQMLSTPRYSGATTNPSGEWAVYTSTNYSFETHEAATTWKRINIASGDITDLPFSSDVSGIVWVGQTDSSVLYLNGTNEDVPGGVTLWTADLADSLVVGRQVASLNAPFSGLEAVQTTSGGINFVVNALAYANNGSAYVEALATKPLTTGRLYDSIYVRHWDAYIAQERYAVFAGSLAANNNSSSLRLSGSLTNLLTSFEAPATRPECPVPDGSRVAFLTKAPELPKVNYTASYLYLVPHDGSSVARKLSGPGSTAPDAAKGASGAPVWSPDGSKIAYLQQDGISYESDRSKLYVADVASGEINSVVPDWDVSVGTIKWSTNCKDLHIAADYIGSTRLFVVPADTGSDYEPKNITGITSVSDFYILPNGDALVSASAVWFPWLLYTVNQAGDSTRYLYKANEQDENFAGLGPEDVDFIWCEGTLGDKQQAIVVYPENFDPNKVYDLIFYVHGGPQGYTGDVWSNRWTLKVWADQGYVLVGPNPSGSTSYGQNLTDRIQGRWGSWPYEDLVNAHAFLCGQLAYVNCSNAVEAGASYGGYMTNWIQGHDLGRELKALVSHDGVATTFANYGTEELWFTQHEFNGTLWGSRETYAAWDPLTHARNFSTPQFVVHSDLDHRLPVSEGIAMFNVLQTLGVPSRFLNLTDENHWVQNRENSLFWHNEIFIYINYWTGKIDTLDGNAITQ